MSVARALALAQDRAISGCLANLPMKAKTPSAEIHSSALSRLKNRDEEALAVSGDLEARVRGRSRPT